MIVVLAPDSYRRAYFKQILRSHCCLEKSVDVAREAAHASHGKSVAGAILKGFLGGLVYVVVTIASGMLLAAQHVNVPNLSPPGVSQAQAFLSFAIASSLLGVALMPLAVELSGGRLSRGLALAILPFVCLGVNATIEILIFTIYLTRQTAPAFIASSVLPTLALGTTLAIPRLQDSEPLSFRQYARNWFSMHTAGSWVGRFALAILAFPVIYFFFGAMVTPFVLPAYRAGIAGLILPPLSVIMPVQILRSTLFLLGSLPCLILWRGRRGSLIFALGLAHWFLVGAFGLMQASFLPPVLRIAHSIEIGADSFAYAAVLVMLLMPHPQTSPACIRSTAPMFPS